MAFKKIKEQTILTVGEKVLEYLDDDPDIALPKLMKWWDKIDRDGFHAKEREAIRPVIHDPESNWYQYMRSFWTDIDAGVRRTLFKNLIVQTFLIGNRQQKENRDKYGCNIPWAILLDPTSSCNLHCTGCWAAEYGGKLNMDYAALDSIVRQGKELGTYMYIFSGGEPLMRKADILHLCEAHPECEFLAFTNGTLIDEAFADEMLRVRNFIPAISVEGFEEATDSRRGPMLNI